MAEIYAHGPVNLFGLNAPVGLLFEMGNVSWGTYKIGTNKNVIMEMSGRVTVKIPLFRGAIAKNYLPIIIKANVTICS